MFLTGGRLMNHNPSRSEKRDERYTALQEKGQMSTLDNLYLSEIRKLRKDGYTVEVLSPHPTRRNLSLCQVFFPEQG